MCYCRQEDNYHQLTLRLILNSYLGILRIADEIKNCRILFEFFIPTLN